MSEKQRFVKQLTGIGKLDEILDGGIPRGHVVLVSGDSGTGKTMLGMEWLFRGFTEHGEQGLYITLTESITEAAANIQGMSFYSDEVFNDGVHFTDFRSTLGLLELDESDMTRDDVDEILDAIQKIVEQVGAERVVIDSITAIAYMLDSKKLIRHFIFRLGTLLDSLDVTTLLTSEVSGGGYSVYGVEEFISDGIITLQQQPLRDDLLRQLQVVKMRGMDYYSKTVDFSITDAGMDFSFTDVPLQYGANEERISFGVSGLDAMCGGGVFKGSVTLLSGPSGSGKTLAALHFLEEGIRNGEKVLYVGFEESKAQLLQNARHFGIPLDEFVESGDIHIRTVYSEDRFPHEHLQDIQRIVEEHDISRVAVDPISSISNVYPHEKHFRFAKKLIGYLKNQEVSTMFSLSTVKLMGAGQVSESNISVLADNVVMMQYTEAGGALERVISVLKTRGTNHDKRIREYRINAAGMHIEQAVSAYEGVLSGSAKKVSKTVEERLKTVFKDVIGPMGVPEFKQFVQNGVSPAKLKTYIEDLEARDVLDEEQAVEFREAAQSIFGEDYNRQGEG